MPLLRDDSMVPIRVHMRVHQCDHVVSHRGFTPWFHTVVSHRGFTPWFHTANQDSHQCDHVKLI